MDCYHFQGYLSPQYPLKKELFSTNDKIMTVILSSALYEIAISRNFWAAIIGLDLSCLIISMASLYVIYCHNSLVAMINISSAAVNFNLVAHGLALIWGNKSKNPMALETSVTPLRYLSISTHPLASLTGQSSSGEKESCFSVIGASSPLLLDYIFRMSSTWAEYNV